MKKTLVSCLGRSLFKSQLAPAFPLLVMLSIIGFQSSVFAQGSLTPPPGAPAPTMKTLAQIEPRTPISTLPYTISNPGSYYLTTNLTGVSGNSGITIFSGNVVLDLGGFTLQGVPGSGYGVYVSSTLTNLVVRNGTLTGWGNSGLDAYSGGYPRNMLFEHLTVSANGVHGLYTEAGSIVRDCLSIGNGSDGISSEGGEITHCISRNNGGYGFSIGGTDTPVSSGTLLQCLAEYNSSGGFSLTSGRALDCDSQFNSADGFDCYAAADEIRKCRIVSNGGTAIYCYPGNGANVIDDCEIVNNSEYGIYTEGTGGSVISRNNFSRNGDGGIIMGDSNNYIENNHVVTTNGVYGIVVNNPTDTNNVVIKNIVTGGGAFNYFTSTGSDFGPIGTAATATSPWANISH